MGDVLDTEVDDDLNPDEQEVVEAESFPDPDLDDEPEDQETEPSASMDEVEGSLPAPSASPIPTYTAPPISDGGFTPSTPARETYQPPPPPPQPEVKFYTVAQLSEAVMNGVISEDQKFEQLQLQNRELAKRDAIEAMRNQQREQTLKSQLSEYSQLVPGWDTVGTPANLQATQNYQRLLGLGLSENDTTKLLALEQTFGPAHRIKAARATTARTAAQRATAPEVGRRGSPPSSSKKSDPLSVLTLDEKRLYKNYIDKGIYKNWNEVRKEVQYSAQQTSNPQLRAKHAGLLR